MSKDYFSGVAGDIAEFKAARESYKKQYWLRSRDMPHEKRKRIKKLFMKIDRLRNHMILWLKQMVNKQPSNYESYVTLIERGKEEIQSSFQQLDKVMYDARAR